MSACGFHLSAPGGTASLHNPPFSVPHCEKNYWIKDRSIQTNHNKKWWNSHISWHRPFALWDSVQSCSLDTFKSLWYLEFSSLSSFSCTQLQCCQSTQAMKTEVIFPRCKRIRCRQNVQESPVSPPSASPAWCWWALPAAPGRHSSPSSDCFSLLSAVQEPQQFCLRSLLPEMGKKNTFVGQRLADISLWLTPTNHQANLRKWQIY